MAQAFAEALTGSLGSGGSTAKGRTGPDWFRAQPLAPPPDLPLYLPSPALRAGAMAKQAVVKAEEAAEAARKAVSASAEASDKARTAEVASARAASSDRVLAGFGYVDHMVRSLNLALAQAMGPPDADAPAAEVRGARELARRSRRLKLMADDDLRSLKGALGRDADRLAPEVRSAMERLLGRLRVHRGAVSEIDGMARSQLKLLEREEPLGAEPPRLPRELLLPDGTPRWPRRLPPPALQPQQRLPLMGERFL